MNDLTRKDFLKTSLAAGATLLSARAFAATAPTAAPAVAATGSANGDVRVAIIGVRAQGNSHMGTYFKMPGARLVALCDPDAKVLSQRAEQAAKAGIKVTTYRDIRKLLEDRDVDAVVIATPNHWHSLATIWACQAGKDVYVEKPLSHNVWEGRQAVAAARKYNRIVQAGTQSRSSQDIKEAIAFIRAGEIGKIQWARGICYKPRDTIGKSTGPQPVPANIDYDLWSGPAPLVWPRRNSKNGSVHYDWHWFWNYGGGDIANQGIHQMDVARWMLGETSLPSSVMSMGGRFGYDDDAETPNTQISVFNYEKAPLIFEVRGLPSKAGMRAMDHYRGTRIGVVIQCEGGYVNVGEGGAVVAFDNTNKQLKRFIGGGASQHRKNFIDAVRNRRDDMLNAHIEDSHLSTNLCHLGNISYRLGADRAAAEVKDAIKADAQAAESYGRMLSHLEANDAKLDEAAVVLGPVLSVAPGQEAFVTKEKYDTGFWANTMLRRDGRAPFTIPELV